MQQLFPSLSSSDMSTWLQFFRDASIPPNFANIYASKFTENRIRFDMLADIDKHILNEMGITAIGDILSILKHSKTINSRLEEKKKELNQSETTPNLKGRGEVAKRIIETYLNEQIVNKNEQNTTSPKSTSTLSADLISRLNFNPNSNTKVTFNEESLSKVVVSSTTNSDDDFKFNNKNLKRKYIDEDENEDEDEDEDDQEFDETNDRPLEYRGFLKQTPSKIINLNKKPNRATSLNESLKLANNKSVKSRLSITPTSPNISSPINSKIIKLNKSASDFSIDTNNKKLIANLESIKNDSLNKNTTINEANLKEQKQSIFKRLKTVNNNDNNNHECQKGVARLFSQFGLKKTIYENSNNVNKITPITFNSKSTSATNTTKTKIIPITFDKVSATTNPSSSLKTTLQSTSNKISLNRNRTQSYDSNTIKTKNLLERIQFN